MSHDPTAARSALISHALHETLDAVVTPDMRERLLREALSSSPHTDLPEAPVALRAFLDGPLFEALQASLGRETAEHLAMEIDRVLRMADAAIPPRDTLRSATARHTPVPPRVQRRSTSPAPRRAAPEPVSLGRSGAATPRVRSLTPRAAFRSSPTPRLKSSKPPVLRKATPLPISSHRYPRGASDALGFLGIHGSRSSVAPKHAAPFVLVLSADPQLPSRFAVSVDQHARVYHVKTLLELVRHLEAAPSERYVVLLDCRLPSVRPCAVAALADELLASGQVVLWGASDELRAELLAVSPSTSAWLSCHSDATLADVAERCFVLVC